MLSEGIKSSINRHKVISFDMYDTLVKRNVRKPEDVFSLVEIEYNTSFADGETISGFSAERVTAYEKAYSKYKAKCTIDNIYEEIMCYSDAVKQILKSLELKIEQQICTVNYEMKETFEYAKSAGKIVAIITDMYLPEGIISSVLEKCGITGYSKLFVSCEYGVSKTDGGLYNVCSECYGIELNDILHFGDGIKNDVVRAYQKGVQPIRVKNKNLIDYDNSTHFQDESLLQYSVQQALINNEIMNIKNPIEKLGFEVFGPLVYGFCTWLHDSIHRHNIEKVFFLAREGLIFKTVYEIIYPNEIIPLKYLYVSRKSLVEPTYWIEPQYENVIKSIAKSKNLEVATLIKRWGLDPITCVEELAQSNLTMQSRVDGRFLQKNDKVRKLYELLKNRIVSTSYDKYVLLEQYLKQESFGGRTAIVDIGWNGGMQNAFAKIASKWEKGTEIYGYYIGINTTNLGVELENTYGYVYEGSRDEDNRYYIYSFAGPLELSLTATHNTTIGYTKINDIVTPKYGSGEYISADGSFSEELMYTSKLQKGIKRYTELYLRQEYAMNISLHSDAAFRNCREFGLLPKSKHIKVFSTFSADDLGVEQHFVNPKYKHLFGKNNVIAGFWSSTWKSGYMKMLFKLPLPYYKIYTLIRRRVN